MTVGDYLGYLSKRLEKDPDIANQRLYSPEGILFGWEDHLDAAKRLGVPEEMIRVWINNDLIEGVKSNDHIIIPPDTKQPVPVKVDIFDLYKEEEKYEEE